MNKLLYTASIVFLGAVLAVAQSGSSQSTGQQNNSVPGGYNSSSTTTTETTETPSTLVSHPQTVPGSMSGNADSLESASNPGVGSETSTSDRSSSTKLSAEQSSTVPSEMSETSSMPDDAGAIRK